MAGNVVLMRYDASDQLTAITYPPAAIGAPAQTMSFAYNSSGDVISRTDALGRVVNYAYDGSGNMLSSQDAAGNRVERTYGDPIDPVIRGRMPSFAPGPCFTQPRSRPFSFPQARRGQRLF